MQSYDPNQPQQRSHDGSGYYQQAPQNQPRMTLPPASSFFGPQSSSDYHHSNTPLSEPPPSPYLTGQYNQPQSYPSTDPSTPYMHASAISPQNYNIGPSPHYPPQPPMQQQQMYNPPPQNIEQGYVGMDQQQQQHLHGHSHHQQQQQRQQHQPPQHHQMQMGYPSTSMIPQDQSMQMGYMSPMDQGMMGGGNYPPQQQIRTYSNIPPSQPQQLQQSMHQMPMMQQQQQMQHLHHHSHSEPSIRQHSEMSNNSMLRNNHHILRQQSQPQSIPSSSMQRGHLPSTMESIVPSSENMTQVLQMQQQHSSSQQPSQQQQQHQSQQERDAVVIISDNNKMLPPPSQPSSNYNMPHQQQHTVMNQGMDQRRFDGPPIEAQYIHPHSNTYSEQSYQHITPMGPPPIPHRVFHEQQQQQVSQDYHQQQMFESQQQQQHQLQVSNFPLMNEPMNVLQTKPEQQQISHSELSIAETVNEVIAKHSAKLQEEDSTTPSPQPQPKKRRNTRTVDPVVETTTMMEQPNVGPTVRQHFQAQQNEKRKQEQHDKYLTKIQEDKERYKNAGFDVDFPEPSQMEPFRGPGMTRTEFLQAHRQRKSESHQEHQSRQQFEKDTVVQIIEEIAGSNFSKSPQPPPYEFSQQQFNDNIQIIEVDSHEQIQPTMQSFDDIPDTVVTPTKPKPKRVRKKPPPRETKVQKENKKKFLFKCLHLQRTIRSLILKNSALADETSRLFYRIKTVTEERKMLAKRVQHYERNRIRRIQSQKKKKAKAEAQLAQTFLQQEIQEVNYPPSVEIYEPEVVKESVEAYPFENMMHKEMAVYLPQPNEADFGQIPYLDPSQYPFEDFNEPMNPDSDYSNIVYSGPTQFDDYSDQQNYQQSFPSEMQEEGPPPSKRQRIDPAQFEQHQYFNPEDDSQAHQFFEQQSHQQQQPISRSETPTFRETPNSSSAASSRPHSSLSGQIKRGIR